MIGTGLLRQFLPTLDYPGRRLVLRPRGDTLDPAGAPGIQVPFALALVHLLIASGHLDDLPGTFVVDSGLQDEDGAAFTCSAETLAAAGIAVPETAPKTGESGAGDVTLELGHFPIRRLALGDVRKHGHARASTAHSPPSGTRSPSSASTASSATTSSATTRGRSISPG